MPKSPPDPSEPSGEEAAAPMPDAAAEADTTEAQFDEMFAAGTPVELVSSALAWGNWRYLGPSGRCYTTVPVTPEPGDVVECWGPLDDFWEPTDAEQNRRPDNWRPDPTEAEHARLRGDETN